VSELTNRGNITVDQVSCWGVSDDLANRRVPFILGILFQPSGLSRDHSDRLDKRSLYEQPDLGSITSDRKLTIVPTPQISAAVVTLPVRKSLCSGGTNELLNLAIWSLPSNTATTIETSTSSSAWIVVMPPDKVELTSSKVGQDHRRLLAEPHHRSLALAQRSEDRLGGPIIPVRSVRNTVHLFLVGCGFSDPFVHVGQPEGDVARFETCFGALQEQTSWQSVFDLDAIRRLVRTIVYGQRRRTCVDETQFLV
jgi:hypothetical protein